MIGRPRWFQRRKYSGWGLTPKTWEGWAYILIAIAFAVIIQYLPLGNPQTKSLITLGLVAVIILDVVHIMANLPMDEREKSHEAIAERNALYAILTALCVGIGWQTGIGIMNNNIQIDPVIIVALIVGVITKAITNLYLDRKN